MIIGIDPGTNTGMAFYKNGKLVELMTVPPVVISHWIDNSVKRVVFEDSRLQSHVFTTTASRAAALKMARNVGEIDAWCKLIVSICAGKGVDAHGISPKGKGAKLNAEQFAEKTGWNKSSNQHERDAAMVAWLYRTAA